MIAYEVKRSTSFSSSRMATARSVMGRNVVNSDIPNKEIIDISVVDESIKVLIAFMLHGIRYGVGVTKIDPFKTKEGMVKFKVASAAFEVWNAFSISEMGIRTLCLTGLFIL